MVYEVKIPVFKGPLDLLLHLIDKNEVDIYNIPISLITQQYLDYLSMAEEVDLELTSEFLLMACTLLSIKSKMLLPKSKDVNDEEEQQDPREELVEKLLEYKQYKEVALEFREMEQNQSKVYWRDVDEVKLLQEFPPANPVVGIDVQDLIKAFNKIVSNNSKKLKVISIEREDITIHDKIFYVVEQLETTPEGISFQGILNHESSVGEIIVTFLAILELVRRGIITVSQPDLHSDIYIYLKQNDEGGHESAHSIS